MSQEHSGAPKRPTKPPPLPRVAFVLVPLAALAGGAVMYRTRWSPAARARQQRSGEIERSAAPAPTPATTEPDPFATVAPAPPPTFSVPEPDAGPKPGARGGGAAAVTADGKSG